MLISGRRYRPCAAIDIEYRFELENIYSRSLKWKEDAQKHRWAKETKHSGVYQYFVESFAFWSFDSPKTWGLPSLGQPNLVQLTEEMQKLVIHKQKQDTLQPIVKS